VHAVRRCSVEAVCTSHCCLSLHEPSRTVEEAVQMVKLRHRLTKAGPFEDNVDAQLRLLAIRSIFYLQALRKHVIPRCVKVVWLSSTEPPPPCQVFVRTSSLYVEPRDVITPIDPSEGRLSEVHT